MSDPDSVQNIIVIILTGLCIPSLIYILFFAEYPDE